MFFLSSGPSRLVTTVLLATCSSTLALSAEPFDPPVAVARSNRVVTTKLTGFPHSIDIYQTAGATRAIVMLHGGGGNKTAIAYQLGMNSDAEQATTATVNWAWLRANKVALVLPQGQHIPSEPNAATWSNYAMDSGEDDKAFLQALAAKVRTVTGLSKLTLMGHSMGGVMTNRMWCESPDSFDVYVSLAGPASSTFDTASTPCLPGVMPKPYMGIIGDQDEVMRNAGKWNAPTWTISPVLVFSSRRAWDNDVVIGEFHRQQARSALMCGALLEENDFTNEGNVDTWSSCSGQLVLKRVLGAEHGGQSIDARMGEASPTDVMDAVIRFVSSQTRRSRGSRL